jgi:hypothetical protein
MLNISPLNSPPLLLSTETSPPYVLNKKQTKAARPVLGRYYREPEKSGPLPTHLISVLLRSLRVDHFVSDVGDVVFYQTDPSLNGDNWTKNGKHM